MKTFTLSCAAALAVATFAPADAYALIADPVVEEPTVVFSEDLSLVPAIEPWQGKRYPVYNQDETLKPEFFHQPGWKGWYISYGQYANTLTLEMDDDTYIQTPPIELSADGGKVTISFEYQMATWEGQKTKTDKVYVQLRDRANGMDKSITGIMTNPVAVTTEWKEYKITLEGGTADCSVRFWCGSYGGNIRNIKVLQVRPQLNVPVADAFTEFKGHSFIANWREVEGADHYLLSVFTLENEAREYHLQDQRVDGTSFTVEGLDPTKTYHYTVKARNNELTSEESNVVRCFGVPKPVIASISDVSTEGFKVSWDAPYNANTYQLETFVKHTAPADETYYLLDEDFLATPYQNLDPDNAVRGSAYEWLDDYMLRSNWAVKRPAYAGDCIGLDNTYASMGEYGELDGPTMDLSANGGKVTIEMRVRAKNAASMSLYMVNERPKVNEFTSDVIVSRIELWDEDSNLDPLTEEWTNRTFTLTGGNDRSYIAIQAYGYGSLVQIDRLAISQELKAGESVRVPYRSIVTGSCEAFIDTKGEGFLQADDEFECELMGAFVPNEGQDEKTVTSDWSDIASVRLPDGKSGVESIAAESSTAVTIEGGRILVDNPEGALVAVYNVAGTLVCSSTAAKVETPTLPTGIYIVATAEGTTKIAL